MRLNLFSSKNSEPKVNWKKLTKVQELDQLEQISNKVPLLIFKHSTRCGISAMALNRFERDYTSEANFEPYYLDLILYREVSDTIANKYGVVHESPQALLMINGKVVYSSSHNGINFKELNDFAGNRI